MARKNQTLVSFCLEPIPKNIQLICLLYMSSNIMENLSVLLVVSDLNYETNLAFVEPEVWGRSRHSHAQQKNEDQLCSPCLHRGCSGPSLPH